MGMGPGPGMGHQFRTFGAGGQNTRALFDEARQDWAPKRRFPRTWWGRCLAFALMAVAIVIAVVLSTL